MPLVSPLHELIFLIAIPFLNFSDELLVIAFDLRQIVIGKFAILLFQFTLELFPLPLELICVHNVCLLHKMVMTLWAYAPLRIQANSGNNPVGDLVKIAQWEQFETERIAATVAGGNRGHRQHKGSAALVVKEDTQLEQCEIEGHCSFNIAVTIRGAGLTQTTLYRCSHYTT